MYFLANPNSSVNAVTQNGTQNKKLQSNQMCDLIIIILLLDKEKR